MSAPAAGPKRTAGLFDIRTIIGLLMLAYGLILGAMGLFADPAYDKTGGINANLIAGVGMLIVAGLFLLWARLRPVAVDETSHTGP